MAADCLWLSCRKGCKLLLVLALYAVELPGWSSNGEEDVTAEQYQGPRKNHDVGMRTCPDTLAKLAKSDAMLIGDSIRYSIFLPAEDMPCRSNTIVA